MEESREALAQKIEQLEEKVTETVQTATASVAEATANVLETVQNATASVTDTVGSVTTAVQGTVDTVRHSVEGTVDSVKEAFDLSHQVELHPWLMMTGAVAVGFLGETLLCNSTPAAAARSSQANRSTSQPPFAAMSGQRHVEWNGPSSMAAESRGTSEKSDGWIQQIAAKFGPEISNLESLAVGVFLGSIRDLIVEAVPGSIQKPIADIVDGFTEKMGGRRIPGSVFDTEHGSA